MGQLANSRLVEDLLLHPAHRSAGALAWQTAQTMVETGASAAGLQNGVVMTNQWGRRSVATLAPVKDVTGRLKQARTVAAADNQLLIIACTCAHVARSVVEDEDSRDRKYLSGVRTIDGFHVYCGSVDAAISRALVYAPHADVICYRATKFDLAEIRYFAEAIKVSFPGKPLGVVLPARYGLDQASLSRKLADLGYNYCFQSFADSALFPMFQSILPWALFDDAISDIGDRPTFTAPSTRSAFSWPEHEL